MDKNKQTVMIFGSFDILHKGHLNLFQQAKRKGDYLIIVLARDETVKKIKKNYPKILERERKKNIAQIDIVNKAVLGDLKNKYKAIKKYKPDIICFGYDQKVNLKELKDKLKKFNLKTKIYRLKPFYPKIYKSSKMKR